MSWSIALSGNEALDAIVRAALSARSGHTGWSLITKHTLVSPQAEPDVFASPMIERTKQRAQEALENTPGASLGIAFVHGTIRVAAVVNLINLHILDMSPEELQSPKFREEIRRRDTDTKKLAHNASFFISIVRS